MKYFLDTEFIEHKKGIDLISIGIVSEIGHEFYAVSTEFKPRRADKWVKENVLCYLPPKVPQHWHSPRERNDLQRWMKEKEIRAEIDKFIGSDRDPKFYAYYADYDWVVFCRLFGHMIDLPKHFPMFCMDLKQMMVERGLEDDWQKRVPQTNEHHALEDAKWNKKLFEEISNLPHQ